MNQEEHESSKARAHYIMAVTYDAIEKFDLFSIVGNTDRIKLLSMITKSISSLLDTSGLEHTLRLAGYNSNPISPLLDEELLILSDALVLLAAILPSRTAFESVSDGCEPVNYVDAHDESSQDALDMTSPIMGTMLALGMYAQTRGEIQLARIAEIHLARIVAQVCVSICFTHHLRDGNINSMDIIGKALYKSALLLSESLPTLDQVQS